MGIFIVLAISGIYFILSQKKPQPTQLPSPKEEVEEKIIEEILQDLTPKEKRPLTEEERKEIEEVLKNLTP